MACCGHCGRLMFQVCHLPTDSNEIQQSDRVFLNPMRSQWDHSDNHRRLSREILSLFREWTLCHGWSLDMFFELLRNKSKGQTKEPFAWIIERNMYIQSIPKECLALNTGSSSLEDSRPSQEGSFTPISMCVEVRDPGYMMKKVCDIGSQTIQSILILCGCTAKLEAGCALYLPRWFYRKVFASEQLHRDGLIVRQ